MNKLIIIGIAGDDASINATGTGAAVANFSLAVNESFKKKDSDKFETRTNWFRISAWGNKASSIAKNVKKGRLILVEGSVGLDQWTGEDGAEKANLAVRLEKIRYLSKGEGQEAAPDLMGSNSEDDGEEMNF